MKILFRVDAGGSVGLGHFYRTYGLAKSISLKGHNVHFVHCDSEFWDLQLDFEFEHTSYSDKECNYKMVALSNKLHCDFLYVDGILEFPSDLFNGLSVQTKTVFYQNISPSRHLCDIFILPSIHQTKEFFSSFLKSVAIYQGLEYVLFNPQIKRLESKSLENLNEVKKISIVTGGSDPKNVLLTLYELLDFNSLQDIEFNFYVGNNFMFVPLLPFKTPKNVNFLEYDFLSINESQIVVSTFGVSTYELLALGMPVISLGHQEANNIASEVLSNKTDAFMHLGLIDDISPLQINKAINDLIKSRELRKKFNKRALSLLDFDAEQRIISILEL